MRNPEAVFRNPAKPAEARRLLAQHHQTFMDLFGAGLIVVPGAEVPAKVEAFHRHMAQQARPALPRAHDVADDRLRFDHQAVGAHPLNGPERDQLQNGSGQNASGQNASGQNGSGQNGSGQNEGDDTGAVAPPAFRLVL
jgi:hypothetical protein